VNLASEAAQARESSARAVFAYPDFRNLLAARFLVTIASEMQSVAVGWQIYSITHRPLDLGLVGLAQFLPGILLFLAGGHAADRFPRRRIIQLCIAAFACCSMLLLLIALRRTVSIWPIYAVLLVNGAVRAFNGPAGQAFLPLTVPSRHFPTAVAWSSSNFQAAMIIGPAVGGALYGASCSAALVYGAAAVSYFSGFLFLTAVRAGSRSSERPAAPLKAVLDGLRYIEQNRIILGTISLDLFAVLLGGAVALLPVYAKEILHTGPYGLGFLRSAPSVGAIMMAIVLAHWPLRRRAGLTMLWCVASFGAFTIVFGLSRNMWLSLIALVLVGAFDMVSVIVRHTLVQVKTPDEMRGRVSAVNMIFIGASNEVGQFESGITAQWLGTVPAVVLGGIGTIAVVALWARLFPSLRAVDELVSQ
jgi:MFS family permease